MKSSRNHAADDTGRCEVRTLCVVDATSREFGAQRRGGAARGRLVWADDSIGPIMAAAPWQGIEINQIDRRWVYAERQVLAYGGR